MSSRTNLHEKLCELLGSKNVYYQPPSSLKMEYPAIRYSKTRTSPTHADNKKYLLHDVYELTVIDRRADNPVIKKLLELQYCSHDRHYIADNLHHDILTLYD